MSNYRYAGTPSDLFEAKCIKCKFGGYLDVKCELKQEPQNCSVKLFWCQYEQMYVSGDKHCKMCNLCNSCYTMRSVFGSNDQIEFSCYLFAASVFGDYYSIWEMKKPHMIRIWKKIINNRPDIKFIVIQKIIEYANNNKLYCEDSNHAETLLNKRIALNQ